MEVFSVKAELVEYVEREILPRYEHFDKGHRRDHAETVICNSLEIALELEGETLDIDMVYAIAAYHDVGLLQGRANHEKASAVALLADAELRRWFTSAQLVTMAEAVEDHRASNNNAPRTIYGCVVSEADRVIDYRTILVRTAQYSVANYPGFTQEEHFLRSMAHISDKYGIGGYLRLWLETRMNREKLDEMREIIGDERRVRDDFFEILEEWG